MPGQEKKLYLLFNSFMKACILCILHFINRLKIVWYRFKGITIGKRCIISGFPRLYRRKGSAIILEDDVTLHSAFRCNTLISLPVDISTIQSGARVILKRNCGLSGVKIVCATEVSIGEYTIVGPDTLIFDRKPHRYSPDTGWFQNNREGKPITIGKRCYIGTRCVILKGVTIGDDCVISAGTIITKDVPSGHLAQGNPAVFTPLPDRLTNKADWEEVSL